MGKLLVTEWITLDGVLDADSMGVWFDPYHSEERGAYIYETVHAADALLVGRVTYEMLASYWPFQKNDDNSTLRLAGKLNSMPKYVVSSKPARVEWNNSKIIMDNFIEEVSTLKQQGLDILVTGSPTFVQSLMETNLIDEFHFLVHPIIMGSGKRFFNDGMHTAGLTLVKTQTFDKGVSLLCYQLTKK